MNPEALRNLPQVHALLDHPELSTVNGRHGRDRVIEAVRHVIAQARMRIFDGGDAPSHEELAIRARGRLDEVRTRLGRVINATGVLLHTGLGRAPLSAEAIAAIGRAAAGYCDLELDLDANRRGRRTDGVSGLLRELTGAEAAAVVNNNAAATLLALRASAIGREVVVSRGQLVEIGGSYRLPEVFEVSGARLREVGTTNRTRIEDYSRAIGPDTAALLKVHASNYKIIGFVESVGIADLVRLAHGRGLLAIDDVGSGALRVDQPGVPRDEPTIADSISAGADLVLASGDKLLGGPQCGLILGSRAAVGRLEADPLMRALRVDKLTIAALEATLSLALDPSEAARAIPIWSFLSTPLESIRARSDRLAEQIRAEANIDAEAVDHEAQVGGGSAPGSGLASAAVRLVPPFPGPFREEADLAKALRIGDPAILARVRSGAIWIDLRAVRPLEDSEIVEAIRSRVVGPPGEPSSFQCPKASGP